MTIRSCGATRKSKKNVPLNIAITGKLAYSKPKKIIIKIPSNKKIRASPTSCGFFIHAE
jgi:hypothetical protein